MATRPSLPLLRHRQRLGKALPSHLHPHPQGSTHQGLFPGGVVRSVWKGGSSNLLSVSTDFRHWAKALPGSQCGEVTAHYSTGGRSARGPGYSGLGMGCHLILGKSWQGLACPPVSWYLLIWAGPDAWEGVGRKKRKEWTKREESSAPLPDGSQACAPRANCPRPLFIFDSLFMRSC